MFKSINRNLLWLSLSGGEVTLVKYYYDLVDLAVKECKKFKDIGIYHNALAVNKAIEFAKYAKKGS